MINKDKVILNCDISPLAVPDVEFIKNNLHIGTFYNIYYYENWQTSGVTDVYNYKYLGEESVYEDDEPMKILTHHFHRSEPEDDIYVVASRIRGITEITDE